LKHRKYSVLALLLALCLMLCSCSMSDVSKAIDTGLEIYGTAASYLGEDALDKEDVQEAVDKAQSAKQSVFNQGDDTAQTSATDAQSAADAQNVTAASVDLDSIPAFDGSTPYVVINDNVPSFTSDEITTESFEYYSDLDSLGRCGVCYASLGQDLMPTEDREDISSVYPSGWKQASYDFVNGGYLYNRSHLIGFQLAGENANEKNLITATRYANVDGMLPFENMVADYIHETNNHVMYRVTPVFQGEELVARGIRMEALSVEDGGEGISFNVYCYNNQPGVVIDYATGESSLE
jgi:DNA-entry nuclease